MAIVKTSTVSISVTQRVTAGAICLFLGASLIFLVGMSRITIHATLLVFLATDVRDMKS